MYLALIIMAVSILSNFGAGYGAAKWLGFGAAFAAIIAWKVVERFGYWAGALVSFLLASGLWFTIWDETRYAKLSLGQAAGLKFMVSSSVLKLLLLLTPLLIIRFDRAMVLRAGNILSVMFCVVSVVQIGWGYLVQGCADLSCGGPIVNASMNGSMVAAAMPIAMSVLHPAAAWALAAGAGAAAVASGSSLAVGLLGLAITLHLMRKGGALVGGGLGLLLGTVLLSLAAHQFGTVELFSNGDRFPMWKFFMECWNTPQNHIVGTGFGSFQMWSLALQLTYGMRPNNWWAFMHNDWLQMVFEGGVVGLVLMAGTYLAGLRGLWIRGNTPHMKALLVYGVVMFFNYPLHVGLSAAFGLWLMAIALVRPGEEEV